MEAENKPNNQMAFPYQYLDDRGDVQTIHGMTLRDYFANSADVKNKMNDMSVQQCEELMGRKYPSENTELQLMYSFELESKLQFMKADAMLKQREL